MERRMTFKRQILVGNLAPVALMLVVCAAVFVRTRDVQHAFESVATAQDVSEEAKDMVAQFYAMQSAARGHILHGGEGTRRAYEAARAAYEAHRARLGHLVVDVQQQETLRAMDARKAELTRREDEEVALVDAGQVEKALDMVKSGRGGQLAADLAEEFQKFDRREVEILAQRTQAHAEGLRDLAWLVLLFTGAAILLALGVAWGLAARINRALGEAVSGMAASTAQIAATVDEHERTVTQQAGAVSETTTTVEELGVSSRQSAGQADSTAVAARQSFEVAREGAQQATRVAASMRSMKEKVGSVAEQILRLSDQAAQIGSIARMVGELAGETNMLALNAAVEAARAGDHGRGFAVVAAEVRKLADQTRKSAERANALVADIQKATNAAVMVTEDGSRTVEEVTGLAQRTLEAFDTISASANRVSDNAQQVLLNSKQQAIALEQVTLAMKSLASGSAEISTGTRQTQLGVRRLNEVAADLKALI